MGLFSRKKETRDAGITLQGFLDEIRSSDLGVEDALAIPAVSGCLAFLCGAVAGLPVRLYRREGEETYEVTEDYRLSLLNGETGDLLDANQMKRAVLRDYLLLGNGYCVVDWYGNRIRGLHYVETRAVSVMKGSDPVYKTGVFLIGGRQYSDFQVFRILRETKDGVTGRGIFQENRRLLELMTASMAYERRMMKSGAKKGIMKPEEGKKWTQDTLDALSAKARKLFGNVEDGENVILLNGGVQFQALSDTAVETQLNESKLANSHEVYRLFGISPSLVEGKATGEDLKNTVRFAVKPLADAFNSAMNRFLLLESEKGRLFFEVDMDALDGTDVLARYQAYEVALRNSWMQPDDVRREEGMNPLGMNFIRMGLDAVLYDPETGTIYTPNTRERTSLTAKSGEEKEPLPGGSGEGEL